MCRKFTQMDWAAVFERCQCWQVERGVYTTLRLAAEMVGAEIPVWVLQRSMLGPEQQAILVAARQQLLAGNTRQIGLNRQVTRLYSVESWHKRLRILRERLLPSRAFMARYYPVPADSPWIFAYYPLRILQVLVKHGPALWRVQTRDPTLMPTTERAALIWNWLMETEDSSYPDHCPKPEGIPTKPSVY